MSEMFQQNPWDGIRITDSLSCPVTANYVQGYKLMHITLG